MYKFVYISALGRQSSSRVGGGFKRKCLVKYSPPLQSVSLVGVWRGFNWAFSEAAEPAQSGLGTLARGRRSLARFKGAGGIFQLLSTINSSDSAWPPQRHSTFGTPPLRPLLAASVTHEIAS